MGMGRGHCRRWNSRGDVRLGNPVLCSGLWWMGKHCSSKIYSLSPLVMLAVVTLTLMVQIESVIRMTGLTPSAQMLAIPTSMCILI
jgi:hypothetical protein